MSRKAFEREIFGDTQPRTTIDWSHRYEMAQAERRIAIARFPGRLRAIIGRALSTSRWHRD